MKYEIIRTDTADTQLRDVLFYIADDSGDVDIALAYLDKLEHAIGLLAEQPYYGVIAKHPSLRRMGFRMIIVENHLVFYKIRERDFYCYCICCCGCPAGLHQLDCLIII